MKICILFDVFDTSIIKLKNFLCDEFNSDVFLIDSTKSFSIYDFYKEDNEMLLRADIVIVKTKIHHSDLITRILFYNMHNDRKFVIVFDSPKNKWLTTVCDNFCSTLDELKQKLIELEEILV